MDDSDRLRNGTSAFLPDIRMQHQSLSSRHLLIDQFTLSPETPESVQIHFETAKNLYLYGWFVYRFHMVAEQYAFSTLEMALRERLIEVSAITQDAMRLPGLSAMLKMARSRDLISNERFTRRNEWARELACDRIRKQSMLRMMEEGLDELEIDYHKAEPTLEEICFNWLENLTQHIPDIRNMHAHGTDALYPNVLWTFEIVSELINQLFLKAGD